MSWLTDLAGKAENLLEKLDKNAAVALNTDLGLVTQPSVSSVIPIENDHIGTTNVVDGPQESNEATPRKSTLAQLRGSRNSNLRTSRKKPVQDEEKELLMTYLNSPAPSIPIPETTNISTNRETLENQDTQQLKTENTFLKSEIQSLNFEISRLLQKTKQAERDHQELITCQANIADLELNFQTSQGEAQRFSRELQELKILKAESHFELSTEIERLTQNLVEREKQASNAAYTNSRLESERTNLQNEIVTLRENFEKYRTRAQRVLNEKDILINHLRSGEHEEEAIEQLGNEEIVLLRQESEQLGREIISLKTQLSSRDEEKLQVTRALAEAQEMLNVTRQKLSCSEQELKCQKEETQRLQEEVLKVKRELVSAKTEIPIKPPPVRKWSQESKAEYVLDLDTKVRNLTATLVKKQQAVEILTSERNAMRLQLEKAEHKLQDATRCYNRGTLVFDINTTDDAKAGLVPGFLRERPEDTGVTRRVRRAYSTLDSITGSLLRRHPVARLLLQIWVMVLLFSYTPDSK